MSVRRIGITDEAGRLSSAARAVQRSAYERGAGLLVLAVHAAAQQPLIAVHAAEQQLLIAVHPSSVPAATDNRGRMATGPTWTEEASADRDKS
ncbi:hypothetical protein BFF78_00420 [Streptomyces fodineus]|uniref:Uncharacterized protein n=1 Tax=Streptomyces fodineus TaxID=1904616 RepID=A0A1D7Y2F6_9ACTN|nr:hypothetical protein [Streptomyces fodineus]AOR29758.1 hypothetical protein BFF78_00420 [Streptomyces fodineus]